MQTEHAAAHLRGDLGRIAAAGDGATFFADPRRNLVHDIRIDYCFVGGGLADRLVSARVDRDADGSDHQPLWLEIDL